MIKVRLRRQGKRNSPFYRIVAIDSTKKLSGKADFFIGFWNPSKAEVKVDKKKFDEAVKLGAFVTPAVKRILTK